MGVRDFYKKNKLLVLILSVFVLLNIPIILTIKGIIWDSALYLGIAKFLYSGGASGLMEIARPIILPLIIGISLKLNLNLILFSKFVVLIFSLFYVYLSYLIAKEVFNKRTAIITAAFLVVTPVFFIYSTYILTGIPSAVFALLAFYLYIRKRSLVLVGISASIAFLFRFPTGLILASIGLMILMEFFQTEKQFLKLIKKYIVLGFSFLIPIIPFLLFNYFLYRNETGKLWHALFRPWLFAVWAQHNPAGAISPLIKNLTFYIYNPVIQNYFLVFSIFGFFYYITKKLYKNPKFNSLLIVMFMNFFYFTYITLKEFRFSLVFLPYCVIISSYGFLTFYNKIKKKIPGKFILIMLIILISAQAINFSAYNYYRSRTYKPSFYNNLNDLFSEYDIKGHVITNYPLPAVYLNNRFFPNFYSPELMFNEFVSDPEIHALIYSPSAFRCAENDLDCISKKNKIYTALLENYNLVFHQNNIMDDFYVFSKDYTIPSLNKEHVRRVDLASTPLGAKSIVVLRMDNAAALYREENKGNIWKDAEFRKLNNILKNLPVVWNIIPKDIEEMNENNKNYLKNFVRDNNVEVVQNGYSYEDTGSDSEFAGLPYSRQLDRIKRGRAILEDWFKEGINVFVPPFSSADDNTKKALEKLDFSVYSSVPGDELSFLGSGVNRYDQAMSFVSDWTTMENKDYDELKKEFDRLHLFKDHIVFTFHHFNFRQNDFETFEGFLEHVGEKDVVFLTLSELDNWHRFRNDVEFSKKDEEIIVNTNNDDNAQYLTLTFMLSGNFSLNTNLNSINVKNIGQKPIDVCLNRNCYGLGVGQIKKIKNEI